MPGQLSKFLASAQANPRGAAVVVAVSSSLVAYLMWRSSKKAAAQRQCQWRTRAPQIYLAIARFIAVIIAYTALPLYTWCGTLILSSYAFKLFTVFLFASTTCYQQLYASVTYSVYRHWLTSYSYWKVVVLPASPAFLEGCG